MPNVSSKAKIDTIGAINIFNMLFFNHYDKITLISNTAFSFNHDFDCKEIFDNSGERLQINHQQVGLNILVNYQKNTTMLTFSSKILNWRALELISVGSIEDVHKVISEVIDINFSDFMQCTVLKLEITKDVCYKKPEELIEGLFKLAQLQSAYKLPRTFHKSGGKACSFWMKKNNTNKKYIDYLSLYDKRVEFLKQATKANQEFLQCLSPEDLQQILRNLEGKVRFEVKLHSAYMIRKHFELEEKTIPNLKSLLNSEVHVVRNMFDKAFSGIVDLKGKEYKPKNMTQLSYYLALKENCFDVEKTIAYLKNSLGDVKRHRIAKKLAEVMVCISLVQYSGLVLIYNQVIDLL